MSEETGVYIPPAAPSFYVSPKSDKKDEKALMKAIRAFRGKENGNACIKNIQDRAARMGLYYRSLHDAGVPWDTAEKLVLMYADNEVRANGTTITE